MPITEERLNTIARAEEFVAVIWPNRRRASQAVWPDGGAKNRLDRAYDLVNRFAPRFMNDFDYAVAMYFLEGEEI